MSLPRNSISRTPRPERRRVGGGWLSLFAMWMIFIGPLVSQSMPMDHHAGMNMPTGMSMAHEHAQSVDSHHGHDGHGGDGQLHVMWEKCGYCSLLFNCPALPQTAQCRRSSPLHSPSCNHAPGACPAGCIPGCAQPRTAFLDQRLKTHCPHGARRLRAHS